MIDAVSTGIGAGILLSFLAGPVFFALIRTSIEKGFQAGFSLALGVFISDLLFIILMLFGSGLIPIEKTFNSYNRAVGFIGGGIMLGIGLFYMLKKSKLIFDSTPEKVNRAGFLLKGIAMSLFSPPTIIYWITVTSIVTLQFKYSLEQKIVFFMCLLVAQLSSDTLKAYYSGKLRDRINEKTIHRVNQVAGLVLIIFAARLLVEAILGKKLI